MENRIYEFTLRDVSQDLFLIVCVLAPNVEIALKKLRMVNPGDNFLLQEEPKMLSKYCNSIIQ